ncbi:MAG: LysR family transcriptional regulator [Actinomycetia bacterium]|nr:LysR family transcriptional regulator [Actinomycetes bacterium]
MQLHQLEYLVAVAEEGGFTAAADRLHVAQPGVSAQIRKLERELGYALFDRSGHRVRLTAVGEEVLGPARAALAAVAEVRHVVDDLAGLLRGRVRMGSVSTGTFLGVPDVLADFADLHPGVEVTLTEGGSGELLAALRDGRLDLALLGLVGDPPADLHTATVTEETLVLVVPVDHELTARESITPADLNGHTLVAPARGSALRDALEALLARDGITAKITIEATDPSVVARLVRRGLGLAVLPASLLATHADALRGVPITGPTLRTGLALAWRLEAQGPAARELTRMMRHALAPVDGATANGSP